MSFFKHRHKFIALFVAFSFFNLMVVASLPLGAEPALAKTPVSMSGDDQIPGAIEQEGGGYVHKKISSAILPIIIGVVVAGAIVAVLILVVFKTNYNIVGLWEITTVYANGDVAFAVEFSGDKKAGEVFGLYNGTYSVNGKKVNFNLSGYGSLYTYKGKFTSKTTMSGNGVGVDSYGGYSENFTWRATYIGPPY